MRLRGYCYVVAMLIFRLYLLHQSPPGLVNYQYAFIMPENYTILKLMSRLGYREVSKFIILGFVFQSVYCLVSILLFTFNILFLDSYQVGRVSQL